MRRPFAWVNQWLLHMSVKAHLTRHDLKKALDGEVSLTQAVIAIAVTLVVMAGFLFIAGAV